MWHWHWCQQHHVTPTSVALHDASGNGNYVTDPKSHVALNFDCLDIRNIVVPLTKLMASYDAISANGMTWPENSCDTSCQSSLHNQCNGIINNAISITCCLCHCQWQWQFTTKRSCYTSFQSFWHKNGMLPLMKPSASCDTDTTANGITWPRCTSFQLFWGEEHSYVIFNAIGTMWCQFWHQWHHMYKESCFTSSWSVWHNKCNGAIGNSIGIPKMCLDIV